MISYYYWCYGNTCEMCLFILNINSNWIENARFARFRTDEPYKHLCCLFVFSLSIYLFCWFFVVFVTTFLLLLLFRLSIREKVLRFFLYFSWNHLFSKDIFIQLFGCWLFMWRFINEMKTIKLIQKYSRNHEKFGKTKINRDILFIDVVCLCH